jgi:single-strand DNA-binding protein
MNHCTFSGRIAADAETRFSPNGKAITQFKLAVDSGYGEYKRTDFLPFVMFGNEKLAPHLTKGKAIIVESEVKTRSYENKEGKKVYVTEFQVKLGGIEFQQGTPKGERQSKPQGNSYEPPVPEDDDIPF